MSAMSTVGSLSATLKSSDSPSTSLPAFKPPPPERTPPPTLGQHNREILCGIGGLTPDELARLQAEGKA